MADLPAEPETLRDLMKQPGIWLGLGLVALGCAGLVFAVTCLWMMPRAPFEARLAADAARAPKPALVGQRLPDPATAMANPAAIALPAAQPVVGHLASPPETPPAPVRPDAAAAEAAVIAEAEPTSVPPSAAAPVAAAAIAPQLVATAPVAATPVPTDPAAAAANVAVLPAPASDAAAPLSAQPVPAAKPIAAAAPAPAMAKGYRLQLGAMRTAESAQQEWDRLKHQHGDVLGKLAYAAPRVDLGNRGVFYRVQAGPIAAASDANRACHELRQRGVSCILVKP